MDFEAQKHFVIQEAPGPAVMQQSTEFKFFGLLFYLFVLTAFQYVCRDIRQFYSKEYDLELTLRNGVVLFRHLIRHALMRPELDNDEIAATLSLIYFEVFP